MPTKSNAGTKSKPRTQTQAQSQGESLAENPLVLVAGGIALGAVAGMLLPRSQRERDLLAGVGENLAGRVTDTVQAVKDAGKAELEMLLPTRNAAQQRAGAVFGNLVGAAKDAAAQKA
jgi:hypothetical protein